MAQCHDCQAEEGKLHQRGCDQERCPFCGGQLITCNCAYEKLGIDVSPGTWAYSHGLTAEQGRKWEAMLKRKGLIPWIQVPNMCGLCGITWPQMFMVPTSEWEKYVPSNLQREVLCRTCYNRMKATFPQGWRKSKNPHTHIWGSGGPYSGWPNRATWNIMLWINMDEHTEIERAKRYFTAKTAERYARRLYPQGTPDFADGPLSYQVVDWNRIAEALNVD